MPWQQYVADVVLEIDPVTGRLAYTEWGLTVPRQSGKSTFVLAKAAHRASATRFFGPRQHLVYTAQTRAKAREKWEEDYLASLKASPSFRRRIVPHLGNGNEHIRFTNGSKFAIEATTEKAGHGSTIDEAYIDEAFAHVDWRVEQSFGPAMITRLNKQLAWLSTAGWKDGSPYLAAKVKTGRASVAAARGRGLAYFEYSAPEDADPGDRAVWRECMPALGLTIPEGAIQDEYDKALDAGKLNEFRRAYLNQWVPKEDMSGATILGGWWAAAADELSHPEGQVTLAVVFSSDRGHAAIGLAGRRPDGQWHVEVADYRAGTAWCLPWLTERCTDEASPKYLGDRLAAVVVDGHSHEATIIANLKDAGINVMSLDGGQVAQAYGLFYSAVTDSHTVRHRNQKDLNDAQDGATTRPLGDAGTAWARRKSGVDISPVVAVTEAMYGHSAGAQLGETEPGAWLI